MPDAAGLLGHYVVTVDFRPTVAAWLTPTNDRESLHLAVRGAARRWAGLGEPIIPVSATGQSQTVLAARACHPSPGLRGERRASRETRRIEPPEPSPCFCLGRSTV